MKLFSAPCDSLAEQDHCALITTSQSPLQELCKHILDISSPFYNIFVGGEFQVSDFTPAEADEFLAASHEGVTLSAAEIQFILDEYEELENQADDEVEKGISRALLVQLRDIMQHKPRFIFILAGGHYLHELSVINWAEIFINAVTFNYAHYKIMVKGKSTYLLTQTLSPLIPGERTRILMLLPRCYFTFLKD